MRLSCSLALVLLLSLVPAGAAQDFRVLRETRPVNPEAKLPAAPLDPAATTVRVLVAGDSWAQYMWDDGSHQDLFDRFGHADKRALSRSLGEDPGPGYAGPEYAISGSEARQWVDAANYPWLANLLADLAANPDVDLVVLSIGGNDLLAGKSEGGWYKDMDLDLPGSEDALFAALQDDTFTIVDAVLAARPGVEVLLSSYDYPNFNVGFWCFLYACPKRRDLSRDPSGDLITDQELNGLMVDVEARRIGWSNGEPRLLFDHGIGLMHYYYGDGVAAPETLPHPGQSPPLYDPFPGGNPLRPTLRSNFRRPGDIDADPIHLDYEGYQYKITNQTQTTFFPRFRGDATATFASQGADRDGWTNGTATGTGEIRIGESGGGSVFGILSFDTASLPDGATIEAASVYLHRKSLDGGNPFLTGVLGLPAVDVTRGSFGSPALEPSDASSPADVTGAGDVFGSARENGYAVRIELSAAGLAGINDAGLTQFRVSFPATSGGINEVAFHDGDDTAPVDHGLPTLNEYMGSAAPFLDVTFSLPVAAEDLSPAVRAPILSQNSPNPFRASTTVPFVLPAPAQVRIRIYDVMGRHVITLREESLPAGSHSAIWNGRDRSGSLVAPGTYLIRLEAGSATRTVRAVRVGR